MTEPYPPAEPTARALADYEAAAKAVESSIGTTLKLLPPAIAWNHCPHPDEYGRWGWNVRRYTIPEALYFSAHEITQKQYLAVMGENPSAIQGDDLPVTNVRWHEAVKFCRRLSAMEKQTYRLPNEIEWEYACRAGAKTDFHFGNAISAKHANFDSRSPVKVGSYKPNDFGLFDMHGNVAEWCLPSSTGDWDDVRCVRGGGFDSPGSDLRAGLLFNRNKFFRYTAEKARDNVGFRIVRELVPQPGAAFGDSTPQRLLERIDAVLRQKQATLRPSVLITVKMEHWNTVGNAVAAMAQGALASFSQDPSSDELPRLFPEAYSALGTVATQNGLNDPLDIEDVQKVLGTNILCQFHVRQVNKNFEVTGTVRGHGFPDDGIVLETKVIPAEVDRLPGTVAIQVMEALKIKVSQADIELLQQPNLRTPPSDAGNVYGSFMKHVTDPAGFKGIDTTSMVRQYGPRCIPAWSVYLIYPDFRWRALSDLDAMNGPKVGTALSQVRLLILEGRLDEAFERLMVMGPVYRQTPQWYLRLLECCALYDEEELCDAVMKRYTAEHPNYSGSISRGEFLMTWAWYARGGGVASQVNEDDWPRFHRRLAQAVDELNAAVKVFDFDEHARSSLIICATGLGWSFEKTMQIFQDGLKHRPDSLVLCKAMREYLQPYWHGSSELRLQFGEVCATAGGWESGVKQIAFDTVRDSALIEDSLQWQRDVMASDPFRKTLLAIRDAALVPIDDPLKAEAVRIKKEEALAFSSRWAVLSGHAQDAVSGFRETRHISYDHSHYTGSMIEFMADVTDAVNDSGFTGAVAKVRVALAVGQLDRAQELIDAARPLNAEQRDRLERLNLALQQAQALERDGEMTFTAADLRDAWLLGSAIWLVDDGWLVGYPENFMAPIISCPFGFGPAIITGELDPQGANSISIDPTARRFGLSHEATWSQKDAKIAFGSQSRTLSGRLKEFQCRRTNDEVAWLWNSSRFAPLELDLTRPAGFAITTHYAKSDFPLRLKSITIKLLRNEAAGVREEPFAESAIRLDPPALPAPSANALEAFKRTSSSPSKMTSQATKTAAEWHLQATRSIAESRAAKDPVERYSLLKDAIECEMQSGDYPAAMGAIDKLVVQFKVDPWSLKLQILKDALESAAGENRRRLAVFMLQQSESMSEVAQYDHALDGLAAALAVATDLGDSRLKNRIQMQTTDVSQSHELWKAAEAARLKLQASPNDPVAHLAVGRYELFACRNWTRGLEELAHGGDDPLAKLASMDRSTASSEDGYLKAANAWLEDAKSRKGAESQVAFERARHWFTMATPGMNVEARERVRPQQTLANRGALGFPVELLAKAPNGFQRSEITNFTYGARVSDLDFRFDFADSWILSMDIKMRDLKSHPCILIMIGDDVGRAGLRIRQDGACLSAAICDTQNNSTWRIVTPVTSKMTTEWTNVTLVYDAAVVQFQLYVDYQLIDSIASVKPFLHREMPIRLGGAAKHGQGFGGEIRDFWLGNTEFNTTRKSGLPKPAVSQPEEGENIQFSLQQKILLLVAVTLMGLLAVWKFQRRKGATRRS